MSETVLTSPIILDATGQDMLTKLDSIISAINPVAQGVSYDNAGTGMVANNVQSAITELKTGLVNTNSSLTPKETGAISIPQTQAGESAVITIDVSSAPASIGIIGGWQISSASHVAIGTCRMTDLNTISVRIVNNYSSTTSADAKIRVVYL